MARSDSPEFRFWCFASSESSSIPIGSGWRPRRNSLLRSVRRFRTHSVSADDLEAVEVREPQVEDDDVGWRVRLPPGGPGSRVRVTIAPTMEPTSLPFHEADDSRHCELRPSSHGLPVREWKALVLPGGGDVREHAAKRNDQAAGSCCASMPPSSLSGEPLDTSGTPAPRSERSFGRAAGRPSVRS